MAWQRQRPDAKLTPRKFMKLLSPLWRVLLGTLFLGATALRAAEEAKPGIWFLRLQLKEGAFSLVSATTVPGGLKIPRGAKPSKELQLVVEDAAGKAVWTEEMADPSVERLEYTEAAQPGVLQVKEVRRAQVDFTVRVPAASAKRTLAIYRQVAPSASSTPKTAATRQLVGRITLP